MMRRVWAIPKSYGRHTASWHILYEDRSMELRDLFTLESARHAAAVMRSS
jgi:hypothetical protein